MNNQKCEGLDKKKKKKCNSKSLNPGTALVCEPIRYRLVVDWKKNVISVISQKCCVHHVLEIFALSFRWASRWTVDPMIPNRGSGAQKRLLLWGISFGWAPIGFAVKSLFQKAMSSRRLLLTYSNSVGYSYRDSRLHATVRWGVGVLGVKHIPIKPLGNRL